MKELLDPISFARLMSFHPNKRQDVGMPWLDVRRNGARALVDSLIDNTSGHIEDLEHGQQPGSCYTVYSRPREPNDQLN